MSSISPLAFPASTAAPQRGGASMGRDEFLTLLITQLRNQDPTSPENSSEFAAQLAQFSSVEQLANISSAMTSQAAQLAGLAGALGQIRSGQDAMSTELANRVNLQSASGLIGQTVQVRDSSVPWSGEGSVALGVHLAGDAREVEITLRNADGDVVRVLRTPPHDAGEHTVTWDGTDADGAPLPAGTYTATVTAVGPTGGAVQAAPMRSGTVERITVDESGVSLWIDGRRVPFDALLAIENGAAGTDTPILSTPPMP
jgi:flagellar basal-body rod modification protein FlgD